MTTHRNSADRLDALARQDPNNAHSRFLVGLKYADEKKLDLAKASLTRALDLDPEHHAAWKFLGAVNFDLGDFACAKSALAKAVSIGPKDAEAAVLLGNTLTKLNDMDGARDAYLAALRINPNHLTANSKLLELSMFRELALPQRPTPCSTIESDSYSPWVSHGRATLCRVRIFEAEAETIVLATLDDSTKGVSPIDDPISLARQVLEDHDLTSEELVMVVI